MSSRSQQTARPSEGRILIVDDEPLILKSLSRLLRRHGYQVLLANSGREGLDMLERETVDVAISDMRMPEMNGAQFLEAVFARWPDTKRILLTGYADLESIVAAVNQGKIWRFIAKPWYDDDLLLTVQKAYGHRNLLRENVKLQHLTQTQNDQLKALNASLEQKVAERTAQLQAAHDDLKRNFLNTVRILSGLVELRGGHFVGHGRRVAEMARSVARGMDLPDGEVQTVMLAGLLHDIGKVGLPDHLLDKPFSSLPDPLRSRVMKHPLIGENLLMAVDQLRDVAQAIRHHHEYFDGSGYPDKLVGEQIPLAARIIAVVNDYDALRLGTLSKRRHKSAEALGLICDQRGIRYDAAVVDVFTQGLLTDHPELRMKIRPPEGQPWQEAETKAEKGLAAVVMRVTDLQPGMVLAADLIHRDGYLLLAAGDVLLATTITQLRRMELIEDKAITLSIRQED